MIDLGAVSPLIWTLEQLSNAGIKSVVIVVGYQADIIKSFLYDHSLDIDLHFINNKEFETTDSSYSFFLGAQSIDRPFILTSGDTMTTPNLLYRVLTDPSPNVLAVDRNYLDNKMDMKVKIKSGRVTEMSKDIPYFKADGESAELYKFDMVAKDQLVALCNRRITEGQKSLWFETILSELLPRLNLVPLYCEANDWCEIDTIEDIYTAQQFIKSNDQRNRRV